LSFEYFYQNRLDIFHCVILAKFTICSFGGKLQAHKYTLTHTHSCGAMFLHFHIKCAIPDICLN